MPLQIRRGTDAERLAMTQPLAAGELVYVTDSQRLYIGNGSALGGIAITGYTNEDARDAVGVALEAGNVVDTGIVFTKDDVNDRISAQLTKLSTNVSLNSHNITGTGNIVINGTVRAELYGSVHADDSTQLVNAQDGTIVLDNTIGGHATPRATNVYDIGSTAKRFRKIYTANGGIDIDGYVISSSGAHLDLPAGTTLGGVAITTNSGGTSSKMDIQGSVFADDSTLIVDGLSGNVFGNTVSGTLVTGNTVRGSILQSGTTTSNGVLDLYASSNVFGNFYGVTGPSAPLFDFFMSNGTLASPTNIVSGDNLSGFVFKSWTGTAHERSSAIVAYADGNVVNGLNPGKLAFVVTNTTGTGDNIMSFDSTDTLNVTNISSTKVTATSLVVGDGTNLLPSIRFATDGSTDTGFYHDADGVIKLVTDSVVRVTYRNASTTFSNAVVVGNYATSSAPSPVLGMIYYDTTTNHFMGYTSGGWKQLDN